MTCCKWLCSGLLVLVLAVGGSFVLANANGYSCPVTFFHALINGEQSSCGNCCSSSISSASQEQSSTCPITGEDAPCEKCCPLDENN
jgi:hypothetical protein